MSITFVSFYTLLVKTLEYEVLLDMPAAIICETLTINVTVCLPRPMTLPLYLNS